MASDRTRRAAREKAVDGAEESGLDYDFVPPYPGIGRAVIQLLLSPTRLFESLRENPRVLAPFLLLALSIAVLAQVSFSGPFLNDVRATFENAQMSSEQRALVMEKMDGMMGRLTALIPSVVALLMSVVLAAVFLLLFALLRLVSPGPAPRFRCLVSVLAHVGLIDALAFLVKLPLMFAKGTFHVYSSAALLLSSDASETRLFKLLDSLDIFSLWKLGLLTVGLAIVAGRRRGEAAIVVWGSWAVYVLCKVALSGLLSPNVRVG